MLSRALTRAGGREDPPAGDAGATEDGGDVSLPESGGGSATESGVDSGSETSGEEAGSESAAADAEATAEAAADGGIDDSKGAEASNNVEGDNDVDDLDSPATDPNAPAPPPGPAVGGTVTEQPVPEDPVKVAAERVKRRFPPELQGQEKFWKKLSKVTAEIPFKVEEPTFKVEG